MYGVLYRSVTLASMVVLLAASTACSRQSDPEGSSSGIVGPSSTDARGGGGKPGGGGGSLTLRMVTDNNGNGLPNWGDQVTFDISTTATSEPFVDLSCTQNGVVVYGATGGFFDSYPWPWTRIMTLSSPSWQGGGASCTAVLYYLTAKRNVVLASTSFTADE